MKAFSTVPSCVVDTDRALAALVRSMADVRGEIHDIRVENGACRFTALVPPDRVEGWESSLASIRKQGVRERTPRRKPVHKDTCPTCGRK